MVILFWNPFTIGVCLLSFLKNCNRIFLSVLITILFLYHNGFSLFDKNCCNIDSLPSKQSTDLLYFLQKIYQTCISLSRRIKSIPTWVFGILFFIGKHFNIVPILFGSYCYILLYSYQCRSLYVFLLLCNPSSFIIYLLSIITYFVIK